MIELPYSIGDFVFPNRLVIEPMEGFDCDFNGSPGELTLRKYRKYAASGASVIWFEACAVCEEGKSNPRQMSLTGSNISSFSEFVQDIKEWGLKTNGFYPKLILQLTHSGRQSYKKPLCCYHNDIYEVTRPIDDDSIVSDEYLDSLPEKYLESAILASKAGFDGVDIKSCHGYLMQESLSSFSRKGKYGGPLENRKKLYLNSFTAVREYFDEDFIVTTRFGVSDMVPRPYGFGTDEKGELDLSESFSVISDLKKNGLKLLNITIGNPYYNPHINRPYRVGYYKPEESPETGVKRFEFVEREIKKHFPDIALIGCGLSYLRENALKTADGLLKEDVCDLVGFGRMALAYPEFYKDYIKGEFDARKACMTCSKCTKLMRNGLYSGCAIFDDFYKNLYERHLK